LNPSIRRWDSCERKETNTYGEDSFTVADRVDKPLAIADALGRLKVYEVMTERPLAATPETSLREVALLMIEHKIGGLPVVSNSGDVVGIITESDIFRAFVGMLGAGVATRS